MKLYVGTSGYSYKEWKGTFYPKELPDKQMLTYYGERFRTVEINNTFYRMPTASLLEAWAGEVVGDFKFVLDGKRLKGSWVLVRTRRGDPKRAQWLLIKHRDDAAEPESNVTEEYQSSAATGRTMDEIAAGAKPRRSRQGART